MCMGMQRQSGSSLVCGTTSRTSPIGSHGLGQVVERGVGHWVWNRM